MRRRIALGVLVVVALLGGCSTSATGTSTTTTAPGSLNATPCNYAQAWRDNPIQFSEFATLARYARMAESAHLRAEGQQLASAVASHNTAAISAVAGNVFATCQQLGLVTSPRVAPSTTG
jgi:hypothetical protein